MIFTLRLLGLEVLHIELAQPDDDCSRDLSGGVTSSYPVQLTQPYRDDSESYEDE